MIYYTKHNGGFPSDSEVKIPHAMQATWVQSLDQEESPGAGHGNPLQYPCLDNLTRLKQLSMHTRAQNTIA